MPLVNEGIEVTKSDGTKAAYLERAQLLYKRCQKEKNKINISSSDLVTWLVEMKPDISRSTWRQYKASVVYFLESRNENELADKLKDIDNEGCKDIHSEPVNERKTSAKKKKSVTEREEDLITKRFTDLSESFWARPTLAFFKATMATGLRPEEWQNSYLITEPNDDFESDELPILKVKNAKNTNGRSHGDYRHLHLNELEEADILYIRITLQYANPRTPQGWTTPTGKASSWEEYYKKIRLSLYRAASKLFPTAARAVTMYSCRHQFIANLKKAKYKQDEIAALVGHATDETATVHYGRSKFGRSRKGLPQPNQAEVKRIRNIYKGRPTQTPSPSLKSPR